MRKTAIICETNPYHNGHRAIFEQARNEGDLVIAVMSGNFTQRGTPAVYDKYFRAGLLVTPPTPTAPSAADLVVELPFPWCASGAEDFALGGISVALGIGANRVLCGSESGKISLIRHAAAIKDSVAYLNSVQRFSKNGEGSAAAHDAAFREHGISLGPNDKLALEYLRALQESEVPLVLCRRMEDRARYQSASSIRKLLFDGSVEEVRRYVPPHAWERYRNSTVIGENRFLNLAFLFCRLFWNGDEYAASSGGLAKWLCTGAASATDGADFFSRVRTKRYTDARLRRAMLYAMLHVEESMLREKPRYTVLLAANGRGRAYLSSLRRTGTFPIVTKPADCGASFAEQYALLTAADRLYTLLGDAPKESGYYLRQHPVMLR